MPRPRDRLWLSVAHNVALCALRAARPPNDAGVAARARAPHGTSPPWDALVREALRDTACRCAGHGRAGESAPACLLRLRCVCLLTAAGHLDAEGEPAAGGAGVAPRLEAPPLCVVPVMPRGKAPPEAGNPAMASWTAALFAIQARRHLIKGDVCGAVAKAKQSLHLEPEHWLARAIVSLAGTMMPVPAAEGRPPDASVTLLAEAVAQAPSRAE